jgi:hypothetical protein
MGSTILCDFCSGVLERERMEGVKVSACARDSDGNGIVSAQSYYYGHTDCVRSFYANFAQRNVAAAKRGRAR